MPSISHSFSYVRTFAIGPFLPICCTLTEFYSFPSAAWRSKSEECEKQLQEWQKKISAETTSISKHNRQIKSKVFLINDNFLEKFFLI